MPLPLVYNVRSVRMRWRPAVAAVVGIAGAVAVFVAMLSLARGFHATMVSTGSSANAMVRREGATSENDSSLDLEAVRVIEDAPQIARGEKGPLVSPEVVVVAAFPLRATLTDANLQVRGLSARALQVHEVKLSEGRSFRPGLAEVVAGQNAARTYAGVAVGGTVHFGGMDWDVVGILDAGGSAFDSEIWCDATVLKQAYQQPPDSFQSVTARLTSPDALTALKASLTADPRMLVQVDHEVDYYERQSSQLSATISRLGSLIALVMGVGATLGALNTMYSLVAERGRELGTLRALGFSRASVGSLLVVESVLIALVGGALGCLAVLPVNGLTTGTLNWQTFSHLVFDFRVTPDLLAKGIGFAFIMGLLGGLPPALRAARLPVAVALREL